MQMRPNLNFPGHAARVLAHYQAAMGGELEIARSAGRPMANFLPAECGDVASPLDIDDEERAALAFAKLAERGSLFMPFEESHFARRFGMTGERLAVRWMIGVAPVSLTPVDGGGHVVGGT